MPDPAQNSPAPERSGLAQAVSGAERILEVAFIMPAALAIGWLGGWALDKWLHQHWIYIVGILFGFVAGFIEVLRSAMRASNRIDKENRNG